MIHVLLVCIFTIAYLRINGNKRRGFQKFIPELFALFQFIPVFYAGTMVE
jgi:hypothetical protein